MPPPVLVSRRDHARRAWRPACRTGRARADRGVLARPAHARLPPAALAAVGPRRHPRHGRGADARPRHHARAARAHRPAGGQLGATAPACPPRPTPTQAERDARRRRSRSSSTPARRPGDAAVHDRRLHRRPAAHPAPGRDPGAAPWRALARATLNAAKMPAKCRSASRLDADDGLRRRTGLREYLLVFLVAGTVTYLLASLRGSSRCASGAVAQVRDRDVHAIADPVLRRHRDARRPQRGATSWPATCRSCPLAGDQVFHDAGVVLLAGAHDLRGRRGRRPVRARRPDQAGRPGARRRVHGGQRRAVLLAQAARRRAVRRSTRPRACC